MIKRQKPQWKKEKPKVIFNMNALTFITCGSVDDGKSTLIGRLLMDSKAVLSDQLASASRRNSLTGNGEQPDLAAFTDGLQAEREQGITIDVAWRYFSTPIRKYIIGDTPGHEQYTRNMVTAATNADAAVVIVDATKLDWQQAGLSLLPQTRRHTLLLKLLRVDSVVFAVNKLDAVADAAMAFAHIGNALRLFSQDAGINAPSIVPISALKGYNVVSHTEEWAGYNGPSLLELLETLPTRNQIDLDTAHAVEAKAKASSPDTRDTGDTEHTPHFNVQWVEQRAATPKQPTGRRIYWGRLVAGQLRVGDVLRVDTSGETATVATVWSDVRADLASTLVDSGRSYGLVLDRELDISRGDWLLAPAADLGQQQVTASVAWLDNTPMRVGGSYWALHGHRWTKARVTAIDHQIDIQTLGTAPVQQLDANGIGQVRIQFQAKLPVKPYAISRGLGSLILVDVTTHATAGAVLVTEVAAS